MASAADPKLERAVTVARLYVERGIRHSFFDSTTNLREKVRLMSQAINNEYDFVIESCRGKEGLIAYTKAALLDPDFEGYNLKKGEVKPNRIYICKHSLHYSEEVLAQNIIHEVSHLAIQSSEQQATNLEISLVLLGGGAPFLNAYTCFENICRFSQSLLDRRDKLDSDFAAHVGMSWLKLPSIADNAFNFEMNQLRSAIIFDSTNEINEFLELYKERLNEVVRWRDPAGNTLALIAAREGRLEILKKLMSFSSKSDFENQRNNSDQDLHKIAERYKRENIIKFLRTFD